MYENKKKYAKSIGVPASQLNELLNAKRAFSAEMVLLIGQAGGLDPAPLLALQTDYNLLSAKRNKSFLERLKDIPKIAAVFGYVNGLLLFILIVVKIIHRKKGASDDAFWSAGVRG